MYFELSDLLDTYIFPDSSDMLTNWLANGTFAAVKHEPGVI